MEEKTNPLDMAEIRKMMQGKAVIKQSDMTSDIMAESQDIVVSGIENNSTPSLNIENAAKFIKENLDKKYGPTWQVIIGEGYAYDVTVQNNTLLFMFYNGCLSVLVFKS